MGAQVALYRRWGFAAQPIAVALTLVGAANGLFFAVVPPFGVTLLLLTGRRRIDPLLLALGALALVVAFAIVAIGAIRSEHGARRAGGVAAPHATPLLRIVRRGNATAVVAGVLLERALTFLPPIVVGAVCGVSLGVNRRGQLAAPAE